MVLMNRKLFRKALIVTGLLILIVLLRYWTDNGSEEVRPASIIRSAFYILLFSLWGMSLHWRIIHPRVRFYLVGSASMMVFWMIIRSLKWFVADTPFEIRYLWYFFYIPMLILPLFFFLIAMSLGKPERYSFPSWTKLLYLVTAVLLFLVLTNDFTEWMFRFPDTMPRTDEVYTYGPLAAIVLGWESLLFGSAVLLLIHKRRVPGMKAAFYLPAIPLILVLIYALLYVSRVSFFRNSYTDLTVTVCLFVMASLEACIQCNLIQSNTHYASLFHKTKVNAQIADKSFRVRLASKDTAYFTRETVEKAVKGPLMLTETTRLLASPIEHGYVLWEEDIGEILELVSELEDKREYLTERRETLKREVEMKREEQRLIEKNRLYNELMTETEKAADRFSALLGQMETCTNPAELQSLTARLALVSTHIKRRSNLVFLAEKEEKIDVSELHRALEEWMSTLRMRDIHTAALFHAQKPLPFRSLLSLYDTLQEVLLAAFSTMTTLFLRSMDEDGKTILLLNFDAGETFSLPPSPFLKLMEREGEEVILRIEIGREDVCSDEYKELRSVT